MEQIARAFALTGDAKPYRLHRDLYRRLYDALQKSSVEQAYIEAMWGDPYLHTITHWAAIPQERRENLRKEYPEMQDLAEEVEEDRRDFLDKFDNFNDTPAGQFLNNMGFALSAVASVHPVGGVAVGAAQVGVRIAAGLPKVVKAITALGALEIAREFSILCNKKSGGEPKSTGEAKPRLGTSGYKDGGFWGGLYDNAKGLQNAGVNPKKAQEMYGDYKHLKRIDRGGEIRMDKDGNFYKYDRAHQSAKIHLEKIVKRSDGFWNVAEVDPETGAIIRTLKNRPVGK